MKLCYLSFGQVIILIFSIFLSTLIPWLLPKKVTTKLVPKFQKGIILLANNWFVNFFILADLCLCWNSSYYLPFYQWRFSQSETKTTIGTTSLMSNKDYLLSNENRCASKSEKILLVFSFVNYLFLKGNKIICFYCLFIIHILFYLIDDE